MKIIGLMSGTSLDAIDAALVEIEREGDTLALRLLAFEMQPLDNVLRDAVRAVLPPNEGSTRAICELNFLIGEVFAQAAEAVARKANLPLSEVDLIASHGQTVWHQPSGTRSTLQIGAGAVIAERTGCTVINDFRPRDIAAGGQGAPLVPYFDALFWRHPTKPRVLLNIGGIANLTYVPPQGKILAFDTGPGNVLMNEAVQILTNGEKTFDQDGAMAAQGQSDWELFSRCMRHSYFRQPPPKSTGRETFGHRQAQTCIEYGRKHGLSDNDIVATLANFTIYSIVESMSRFVPLHYFPPGQESDGMFTQPEIFVAGGGSQNPILWAGLKRIFPSRLYRSEDSGLPADAKEAVAFAVLGYAALHGYPANVPSATGAVRPVVLGSITPGDNYRDLLARVVQSSPEAPSRLVLK